MKRFIAGLLIAFLIGAMAPHAWAHNAGEHWDDMNLVLFGEKGFSTGKSKEVKDKVNALQYASQLCIDQFGLDSGKANLEKLNGYGIKGIPASIEEIALYPLHNHRAYTHLGWEYNYSSFNDERNPDWSARRWPLRQNLLRSTVEYVFNFNGAPQWLDPIVGYSGQCESFTKLLYCIHILGDHISYKHTTYKKSHEVMPLAATREASIISELISCLPVLLPKQNYVPLQKELETISINVVSLLNRPEALSTEDGFASYHENAEKVLDALESYLPELLKNEDYFKKAFY